MRLERKHTAGQKRVEAESRVPHHGQVDKWRQKKKKNDGERVSREIKGIQGEYSIIVWGTNISNRRWW